MFPVRSCFLGILFFQDFGFIFASYLGLLSFDRVFHLKTGFYFDCFVYFPFSTGSSNTWKNRPILAQILWPGYNAIGGGALLKEFLNVMIEITMDSLERRDLVIIVIFTNLVS